MSSGSAALKIVLFSSRTNTVKNTEEVIRKRKSRNDFHLHSRAEFTSTAQFSYKDDLLYLGLYEGWPNKFYLFHYFFFPLSFLIFEFSRSDFTKKKHIPVQRSIMNFFLEIKKFNSFSASYTSYMSINRNQNE